MYEKELQAALEAACKASQIILSYYEKGFSIEQKSDNSPVTEADINADKEIVDYLVKLFPSYSFLTEESTDDLSRINSDFVWIIDPLDGTNDFVNKGNEFSTNIALCNKHDVVVAVVMFPALNEIFYAVKGCGSFKIKDNNIKQIHVNDKTDKLTCLISKYHFNSKEKDLIDKHLDKIQNSIPVGAALKACRIAEGEAEVSFRFSEGTKEWDTAAPQLIVEEAGGLFLEPNGNRMLYNRKDVYNHYGYVISNNITNFFTK